MSKVESKKCFNCGKVLDFLEYTHVLQIFCRKCFSDISHEKYYKVFFQKFAKPRIEVKRRELKNMNDDELIKLYESLIDHLMHQKVEGEYISFLLQAYKQYITSKKIFALLEMEEALLVVDFRRQLQKMLNESPTEAEVELLVWLPVAIEREVEKRSIHAGLLWNRLRRPNECKKWLESEERRSQMISMWAKISFSRLKTV